MKYSKPLDGLRALFILAVMGIHAGTLSGGFLGVDSFFTLSGYLITFFIFVERFVYFLLCLLLYFFGLYLAFFLGLLMT